MKLMAWPVMYAAASDRRNQITPAHSTMISDYGINDTSSLLKDVTAVVSVTFEVR